MTRKCAASAWGTRFRTDYVRRSFKADTERHCSGIGEACRVASTDASRSRRRRNGAASLADTLDSIYQYQKKKNEMQPFPADARGRRCEPE